MNLEKALTLSLGEFVEPVVTRYRLGVEVHKLYRDKVFQGEQLNGLKKDSATLIEFNRALRKLEDTGVLKEHPSFPKRVFRLLGRKEIEAEEVACSVDPFCYVSHFSAMSHHGLTDRMPAKLHLSSPSPQNWRKEALSRMEKDLGEEYSDYLEGKMPQMERAKMGKIGRTEIKRFNSAHWGAYKNTKGRIMRVATIGRTFLDMLRNPELCGSMRHVNEVFQEYASVYQTLIIDEIDRHGAPIDKVRAGYLLDEKLQIDHEKITGWLKFAQRGGSRKLDPSAEFEPKWSEKWSLSLNLE